MQCPVWDLLVPYLQWLTANAVTFLLNLTGIPAVLQGTQIWVPAGTFDVIPACSGISQLIVGTMAGALFAYINRLGRKAAIWVVAAAVGISLLVNTLRVYTVVVIGQLTECSTTSLRQTTGHSGLDALRHRHVHFSPGRQQIDWSRRPGTEHSKRPGIRDGWWLGTMQAQLGVPCLALSALVLGPALVYAYQPDRGEIGRLALNLPAEIRGWRAATVPSDGYRPVFQNPDLEYERFYRDARRGRGLPVYRRVCLPGARQGSRLLCEQGIR